VRIITIWLVIVAGVAAAVAAQVRPARIG